MRMTGVTLFVLIAMIIGGCSGQEKTANEEAELQAESKDAGTIEDTTDGETEIENSLEGVNQSHNDAIKEAGKDNSLTEQEMIEIGKRLTSEIPKVYTLKTEEEFQDWINRNFVDKETAEDMFRGQFDNKDEFSTDTKATFENLKAYAYGKTAFALEGHVAYEYTSPDGATETYKYRIVHQINKDTDGEYKFDFLTSYASPDNPK